MMKTISMILLISLTVCNNQSRFLEETKHSDFIELVIGFASATGFEDKLPNLRKCDPVNAETIKWFHNILEVLGGLKTATSPLLAVHDIINDFRKIHHKAQEGFTYCHEAFAELLPILAKGAKFVKENEHKIILNFIENIHLIEENTPEVRKFLTEGNYFAVGQKFGQLYQFLIASS